MLIPAIMGTSLHNSGKLGKFNVNSDIDVENPHLKCRLHFRMGNQSSG